MNYPRFIRPISNLFFKGVKHRYVFILSLPFSGSSLLNGILRTSPNTSTFTFEGQIIKGVRHIMRDEPWNKNKEFNWQYIKKKWHTKWDLSKPILVEKSPPNILRAKDIEKVFKPATFIICIRNPYAFCEGYVRRGKGNYSEAALFWLECAKAQKENLNSLDDKIYIRYEDLVVDSKAVVFKLLKKLPELETVNLYAEFKAKTSKGVGSFKVQDFNAEKIKKLSANNISDINTILVEAPEIMKFFNYKYI